MFFRVRITNFLVSTFIYFILSPIIIFSQNKITTDVLVIGGGTGGTAAGIQSARSGANTIIVEQTNWLGGMLTAAGVSCTDGNDALPSGIWNAFRQALYSHYGTNNLATGWVSETCFEPHVGDSIFKAWASVEKKLTVMYNWYFEKTIKKSNKIIGAIFRNERGATMLIQSKITIDATELGDVFADAGAGFDIGTENSADSKEKMAPGKTTIIQDITWAATLKNYGPGTNKTIAKPLNYDPLAYDCCCTSAPCSGKPYKVDATGMLNYGKLPGNKYMLNWPAHGNDFYLYAMEDDYKTRKAKYELARQHTLGFIYYIQTVLGFKNIGLADDELDNGLALIPYNREGRRVKGLVRLNINHILAPYTHPEKLYRTGIAVGDYPVDHHHGQQPGTPEIHFPPIPSFNVPLGALIPQKIDGLIICEKGISVSNIVNGATRLQPVVLLAGQAAGILAAWCVQNQKQPREADVRAIQQKLLDLKFYLMPYVDVKPDDPFWAIIQRIGATGILKGYGRPDGWANKTFFYPDSSITMEELNAGISQLTGKSIKENNKSKISVKNLAGYISFLKHFIVTENGKVSDTIDPAFNGVIDAEIFRRCQLEDFEENRPLTRKEVAILIDTVLHVFAAIHIDLSGNIFSKQKDL